MPPLLPIKKCYRLRPQRQRGMRNAFSLTELLVVMGIMVLLMALVIPAIQRTPAAQLTTAGAELASLAEVARQNSMTSGGTSALAFVKNFPSDRSQEYRCVTRVELRTVGGSPVWTWVSKWKRLPDGIIVDPAASTFQDPAVTMSPSFPDNLLKMNGVSLKREDLELIVFDSVGRLLSYPASGAAKVRVVAGLRSPDGVTHTGGDQGNNRYDVIFNEATGRPHSLRP